MGTMDTNDIDRKSSNNIQYDHAESPDLNEKTLIRTLRQDSSVAQDPYEPSSMPAGKTVKIRLDSKELANRYLSSVQMSTDQLISTKKGDLGDSKMSVTTFNTKSSKSLGTNIGKQIMAEV